MGTTTKPLSLPYSPSGRTVNEILGAGVSSLQLTPHPSPSSQEYLSNTINYAGIERTVPRLYSLISKSSALGQAPNATAIQTIGTHIPLRHSKPIAPNRHRLPTPKRGFDVTELPVEIVCEIFEKFIEDDSETIRDDSPRPLISPSCHSDPTILGQICSFWRSVAIDLPKLWSNVYIYNPKPSQVRLVNLWLKRSGSNTLSLKIDYNAIDEIFDLRAASQIYTFFTSRLEYWRKIDFHFPIRFLEALFPTVQIPNIPLRLESAVVEFSDSSRYPYEEKFGPYIDVIWKFLHASPNLRQVDWRTTGIDNFPKHAPFHQLTHVATNFELSVDDVLAFLAIVPLIEELSIETIRVPSKIAHDVNTPPLALQHLRVLMVYSRSISPCSLFSSLTCPSLQSLKVNHNSVTDQPSQYLSELIRLLQRSNCQLLTLNISDPYLPDDDLELYLPSNTLRSLTCLFVSKNYVSDGIVRLLTEKSKNGTHKLLPRLERLLLNVCKTTDGLLATMISSRWHGAETSPGALRWALVSPETAFRSIDNNFFSTHVLY